jgi:hypothetical protein
VEVLWARNSNLQGGDNSSASASLVFKVNNPEATESGDGMPSGYSERPSRSFMPDSFLPPPSQPPPEARTVVFPKPTSEPPPHLQIPRDYYGPYEYSQFTAKSRFKPQFFNRLGVKLATGKASVRDQEVDELMPVLVPIFATMLLFVDAPLFVGMISPQHSPLQESVTMVFVGVFLSRLTLVVTYKFMNKAFLSGEEVTNDADPAVFKFRRDNPKQFALRIIVLFTYMASLLILFIPLYHYMYRISFLNGLKAVGSNADLVAIFFLIIVAVCPEVVRSVILILMWFRFVVTSRYKFGLFQVLFAWEWISRIVFVCIALFGVPTHLKDSSNQVLNLIATK